MPSAVCVSRLRTCHLSQTRLVAADNTLELPDADNVEAWYSFVAKVNKSLDEFNLDFRRVLDESTGDPVYVVVRVFCFILSAKLMADRSTPKATRLHR